METQYQNESSPGNKSPHEKLSFRRLAVFGAATLLFGLLTLIFCLCPLTMSEKAAESIFSSYRQEGLFFDFFGFACASWLLCWVSSLNSWSSAAKIGQWLGLIFLCMNQVSLLAVLKAISTASSFPSKMWIAPLLLQSYILGIFFGLFTLPGLTKGGNKTLTGLGTLVFLLPWLVAKDRIILGISLLNGLYF